MLKISDCIIDMTAYTELNDNVLFKILYFDNEEELQTQTLLPESSGSQSLFTPEGNDEGEDIEDTDCSDVFFEQNPIGVNAPTTDDAGASGLTPSTMFEKETKLKEAKEIIERIFKRELYSCIFESGPVCAKDLNKKDLVIKDIQEGILSRTNTMKMVEKIKEDDFVVSTAHFDFGMKEENPVEKLKVYTKKKPTEAKVFTKEESSRILGPGTYNEVVIRVYSRSLDEKKNKDALYRASSDWFSSWNRELEIKQNGKSRARKKPKYMSTTYQLPMNTENETSG